MEYYSAIKRDELMPFAEMWMDLEIIMQSEVSQKEKKQIYHYMWNPEKMVEINLFAKQK